MKLFCTPIVCVALVAATASNEVPLKVQMQNSFSDSIYIHSHTIKRNTVRLYPNPTSDGVVTISSITNEALFFYVFDVEGTLIRQVELKAREEKKITGLGKGTYSYDVFQNDESIEQGKIIVK
jgi:hypothetical protein